MVRAIKHGVIGEDIPPVAVKPWSFRLKKDPSNGGFSGKACERLPEGIPSGKRLHNYGKSPFFMGKLTINGHFQ